MIKLIEELSANAWSPLNAHLYDGWIIGESKGYTRRANSVRVVGDSSIPFDDKINYCEDFYKKNNLPVIFKIVRDKSFVQLDNNLKERKYKKVAATSVRIKDISQETCFDNSNINIEYSPSDKWVDMYLRCTGKDASLKTLYYSILKKIKQKGAWTIKKYIAIIIE